MILQIHPTDDSIDLKMVQTLKKLVSDGFR
jgi:hypothetical protein